MIAYWLMSASTAAATAALSSGGQAKSGKPWARLTAPAATASRFISRMTDSVKPSAFAEIRGASSPESSRVNPAQTSRRGIDSRHVAPEERLAVEVHLEIDRQVECVGVAGLRRARPDLGLERDARASGRRRRRRGWRARDPRRDAVSVSVSAAYRRRPSSRMSSPPSWMVTVVVPAMTSFVIRQTGSSAAPSAADLGKVRRRRLEGRDRDIARTAGGRHDRQHERATASPARGGARTRPDGGMARSPARPTRRPTRGSGGPAANR